MSERWAAKDKDENLSYSADWSRFLDGSTINSAEWYIVDEDGDATLVTLGSSVNGLVVSGFDFTSTVSSIRLAGGINNTTYKIVSRIYYGSSNLIAERTIRLPIQER